MLSLIQGIDSAGFNFINHTAANPLFDFFFPLITEKTHWIIPLVLFYLYLFRVDWKRASLALAVTVIGVAVTDVIAAQILKPLFGRVRPSHELTETVRLLVGKGGKLSFPSNHAANSMALACITSHFFPRMRGGLLLIALLVAFSRIYVGVHYPGDVLVGAIYGGLMAMLTLHLYSSATLRSLARKHVRRGERNSIVHADSSP